MSLSGRCCEGGAGRSVCSFVAGEVNGCDLASTLGLAKRGAARIGRWLDMVRHSALEVLAHGFPMLLSGRRSSWRKGFVSVHVA